MWRADMCTVLSLSVTLVFYTHTRNIASVVADSCRAPGGVEQTRSQPSILDSYITSTPQRGNSGRSRVRRHAQLQSNLVAALRGSSALPDVAAGRCRGARPWSRPEK